LRDCERTKTETKITLTFAMAPDTKTCFSVFGGLQKKQRFKYSTQLFNSGQNECLKNGARILDFGMSTQQCTK